VNRVEGNYTYYFPLTIEMADQPIEVIVLGFGEEMATIKPEVWITAYPLPFEEQMLVLEAEY